MAIRTVQIDVDHWKRILETDEGHFFDIKSKRISPAKLTKTLSAFANADGGDVYIGIEEDKTQKSRNWDGFHSEEDANGHIQIFESLFPLSSDCNYEFISMTGASGKLLHVNILKTQEIKTASDSIVYIRRGAQNLPVDSPEKMKILEFDKGISSFENEKVSDADLDLIVESEATKLLTGHIVPKSNPVDWIRKQRLSVDGSPNVAGLILLCDEPQAVIPKRCGVKIYRYKTSDNVGSRDSLDFDPITIEGCAYEQIKASVFKTTEIIESIKKLGEKALEKVEYPNDTLHEIITNAIIHRDYRITDDVHIRIFDNRVEVQSPGKLPAHITIENILEERFARNGKIVRILNKFPLPPNKDVGEGLNTAFDAMRQLGLRPPVISESGNSVIVTIKHERLASPEDAIMEYLDQNGSINNSEARGVTNISADYRVKAIFNKLVDREMIEQIPGTDRSTTRYRLKQ